MGFGLMGSAAEEEEVTPRGLWTRCRSPLCGRELRRDNRTGFCAHCQQGEVPGGRRWFKRTRPHAAEYRAQDVARRKERELARWARGLCVWCKAPSEQLRCDACRARKNAGCRRWRASHVRVGMCCKCMRSAMQGKTKCAAHLAADAAERAEVCVNWPFVILAACVAAAFGVPLYLVLNRRPRPPQPLSDSCASADFRDQDEARRHQHG